MGKCRFCGDNAGFLNSQHCVCFERYTRGKDEVLNLATSAAKGELPVKELLPKAREICSKSYIPMEEIQPAFIQAWQSALDHILEDGILTEEEEGYLKDYAAQFNFNQQDPNGGGINDGPISRWSSPASSGRC